jgi:hypothetical protein
MIKLKINKEFRDLIPTLSDDEFKDLEASVLEEGIRDPIRIWNDIIVDGHHRYKLAGKHDLDFQTEEMEFENEIEAKIWILANQLSRRNITLFVRAELEIEMEEFYREKARLINTAVQPTVAGVEHNLPELKTDTRKEIAKAAGVSHGYIFNVKQIKDRNPDEKTLADLRSGKITPGKVWKEMRREEAIVERDKEFTKAASLYKPSDDIQIINADFYRWCNENLDNASVDLILTDPPYPKEFLYLWEQLAEVAARVLKPNGYLVTYSGQLHLDYVMRTLGNSLFYCWMIALKHTGATQVVHPRRVVCAWKPVLVYKKGVPAWESVLIYKNGEPGKFDIDVEAPVDFIGDDYREKGFHEWGQGKTAVSYLMRKFSKPGELVLDPFVGGGTCLVVAQALKRRCIGIEIDEQYIDGIKADLGKPVQEALF